MTSTSREEVPVVEAEPVIPYEEYQEADGRQVAGALVHSFGHSLVQGPIDGLTEIVNKLSGKKIIPRVQLVEPPEKAEISTAEWHAQKMGSGAGLLVAGIVIGRLLRGRII